MDVRLLSEFGMNKGAADAAIADAEASLQWTLPVDYKAFLRLANGGEGFVGEDYLILWEAEELAQFNREYEVQDYAPGLILFGSDGGGEGFAFDTRSVPVPVVQVPFIGMELRYARLMANSFDEFLAKLAG